MTELEYESILNGMTYSEFDEFRAEAGGDSKTRAEYVREFWDKPELGRSLCRILEMPTEQQRRDDAAKRSVDASVKSADASRLSASCAVGALLVSIAALVVSILAYFKE